MVSAVNAAKRVESCMMECILSREYPVLLMVLMIVKNEDTQRGGEVRRVLSRDNVSYIFFFDLLSSFGVQEKDQR